MCILNISYMRCYSITTYTHIKELKNIKLKKLKLYAKKGRLVGYKGNNISANCLYLLTVLTSS